jgi:beta-N-acetylhexosaminidase
MQKANQILKTLTEEDLIGQLLCYDIYDKDDPVEVEKVLKEIHPGGIYVKGMTPEKIAMYRDMANKYTKVPVIVAADVENGPGEALKGTAYIPHAMALGAADDPALVEETGVEIAKICRKSHIDWNFSPVVDLQKDFRSPITNIRAVSDDPDEVIKIQGAFLKGLQSHKDMVGCCKHFPGDGDDERNCHFVTTLNPLSKQEWMASYGKVYKAFIAQGVPSIMVGHIALPWAEKEIDPFFGPLPGVLSKGIMTDLLKNELGFKGCVVSDAMSMIGVASRVQDLHEVAIDFIQAGGDMVLFPEPTDFASLLNALHTSVISLERVLDAVSRVLYLKERADLFNPHHEVLPFGRPLEVISQQIADESIKVVRDRNHIIPMKAKKVLILEMFEPYFGKAPSGHEFDAFEDEFKKNGCEVKRLYNPDHKVVAAIMNDYDLVVLACKMSSDDYHGGTLRIGWNEIMVLWRGYVLQHPHFVFVSFGDPYKLFDCPYLKEYINAFSNSDMSMRSVAKVLLGKIPAQGKNPIDFLPYFKREV